MRQNRPIPGRAAKLRVGLSGAGAMGCMHARVLARIPDGQLAGVFDIDAARSRALAAQHGVPAVAAFESLLERCDAVIVATSTAAHVEQVLACVASGRHVLVEKPAAPDLAGALALREAVGRAGVVVQAGHVEHFNPTVAALRRVLAGALPLALSSRRLGPPAGRSDALDVITDLMLHDIHVVVELGPGELASAAAVALGAGASDYAHAVLRFSGGLVADLTASRIAGTRLRVLEATTPEAHVTADYVRGTVQIARWRDGRAEVEHAPVSAEEPLERELLAFLRAIRRGTAPEVGLDAAVRCLRVVDALRRSAEVVLDPPAAEELSA
jgi:predicted dehydrogenase